MKTEKLTVNTENKLESRVKNIVNGYIEEGYTLESFLNDLMVGGCQSGFISELIYYTETVKFYNRYKNEINTLLSDTLTDTGLTIFELFGDKWGREDGLALDQFNQNLLAWFGFEETVRILADRQGIEI